MPVLSGILGIFTSPLEFFEILYVFDGFQLIFV